MADRDPSLASELAARGRFIAARRAAVNLTQQDLAEALGVSRDTIRRIEQGRADLSASQVLPVAAALNIGPDALLDPPADGLDELRDAAAPDAVVRQWAARAGVHVPRRGPVPKAVVRAHGDASTRQPDDAP